MRTKHTGPAAADPQPYATPTQSPPPQVKSPQPAPELTAADRANVKEFLERTDKPFSITIAPQSRKRKRGAESPSLREETELFHERLSVQYEVKPSQNWESLKRYKKFTVGGESIAVGECIMVKNDMHEDPRVNFAAQWKAKVLEVRALDAEHVYVRIAWMNRPEDLDEGRQPHHGKLELIATNHMDIIDAMTVNGRLDLYAWDETDDEVQMPGIQEHFWRQTLDVAKTRELSKLRLICQCQQPQNPDVSILQCDSPECRKWMHVRCIVNDAVQRAAQESTKKGRATKAKKSNPITLSPTLPAIAIAQKDAYTAELFVERWPDDTPSKETKIVITNGDGEKRTENVHCLLCHNAIEPTVPED
ncbi:hypothetical protein LTR10_007990 [Elasticomyces elasticus]|nr:hypothetical protein LTR10_007990 [Elasticomyces elasticus]KAK4970989.1 hypothetical protein LTR42_007966 [Elasticomyces elasticus]